MALKVGSRLRAQNSACEVIIVKGSAEDIPLMCSGVEMVGGTPAADTVQLSDGPPVELGKRYVDDEAGIEVLCVKPGLGQLAFGGRELVRQSAQALPASD